MLESNEQSDWYGPTSELDDWKQSVAECLVMTVRNSDLRQVGEAGSNFASILPPFCLPDDAAEMVKYAFQIGYA